MTRERFIEFLRRYPEREYDPNDPENCALAQFARSLGFSRVFAAYTFVYAGHFTPDTKVDMVPSDKSSERVTFQYAIRNSKTFGELALRLDSREAPDA